MNLLRTIRYYVLRFKRLQGTPHSLAMGAALGMAIGITPTLPLHTIMIIGITLLLRVSTIAALLAAAVVSNPLTFAPQYYLAWYIGDMLLPGRLTWERIHQVLDMVKESGLLESMQIISRLSSDAILVMLTGGLVLAVPLGLLTYFSTYHFFEHIRIKRRQKHLLN